MDIGVLYSDVTFRSEHQNCIDPQIMKTYLEKSRIRETPKLSTDADCSTVAKKLLRKEKKREKTKTVLESDNYLEQIGNMHRLPTSNTGTLELGSDSSAGNPEYVQTFGLLQ